MISGACVYDVVDIHAGCYKVNRICRAADDLRGSELEESVIIDQLYFQLLQRLSAARRGYYFIHTSSALA